MNKHRIFSPNFWIVQVVIAVLILLALVMMSTANAQTYNFQAGYEYHLQHDPACMLVMQKKDEQPWKTAFFECPKGVSPRTPMQLFSGTKGYGAALYLWGEQRGYWDESTLIGDLIPQYGTEDATARGWNQQMYFSSRLATGYYNAQDKIGSGCFPDNCVYDYSEFVRDMPNKYPFAETNPGVFRYGPVNHQILGSLFYENVGLDPVSVLNTMGITASGWNRDASGKAYFSAGAYVTPQEWARYGVWLMNRPHFLDRLCTNEQDPNPGFGLYAWCNRDGGWAYSHEGRVDDPSPGNGGFIRPEDRPEIIMFAGSGGQRLYILPKDGLVIVRQCFAPTYDQCRSGPDFANARFLSLILD